MAKYEKVESGASFTVKIDTPLIMACCSCGLVHNYTFKLLGDELEITINRDERRTAMVRRHGDCGLMKNQERYVMQKN